MYTMMKKMTLSAVLLCALAPLFAQGPMQNLPKMSESVLKETLVYSVKDGQELLMDKYVDPAVPYDGDRPVLIYAFGGGFAMGSRSSAFQIPYYKHFVDRGFVVLAIDYRLGVKAPEGGKLEDLPVPEGYETRFDYAVRIACEDMIDATAYVVAHADEWGVDPTKIILSGSSAGAMTSLNAAYEVAGEREFASRLPEDFNYGGVISLAGCIYVPETEPVWKKTPCPILFFHGSDDPTVPFNTRPQGGCWCYGSNYLHEQFTGLGFSHWLYEETGSDHIIAMTPLARNYNEIDTFIDKFVMKGMKLTVHTVFTAEPPATDETVGFRIFD